MMHYYVNNYVYFFLSLKIFDEKITSDMPLIAQDEIID